MPEQSELQAAVAVSWSKRKLSSPHSVQYYRRNWVKQIRVPLSQFQRLLIAAVWLLNYRRSLACGNWQGDFPAGKEYNEGKYRVFINKCGTVSSRSGIDLSMSAYTLHAGADSLLLTDCLPELVGFRLSFDGESEFDSITCRTVGDVLFLRWVLILFDEKWYEGVIVGHVPLNLKGQAIRFHEEWRHHGDILDWFRAPVIDFVADFRTVESWNLIGEKRNQPESRVCGRWIGFTGIPVHGYWFVWLQGEGIVQWVWNALFGLKGWWLEISLGFGKLRHSNGLFWFESGCS